VNKRHGWSATGRSRRRQLQGWTIALSLACATLTLGFATLRLRRLEASEFAVETPPATLRTLSRGPHGSRSSARLGQLRLELGQRVDFQLCGRREFAHLPLVGQFEVVVLQLEAKQLMLRAPLDAPQLAAASGRCLSLGAGQVERAGTYSVEAVWRDRQPSAAALDTPLALHISARPRLAGRDLVLTIGLGLALLGYLSTWLWRGGPEPAAALSGIESAGVPALDDITEPGDPAPPRLDDITERADPPPRLDDITEPGDPAPPYPLVRASIAMGAVVLVYAFTLVPSEGALPTMLKGSGLLALQLGLSFGLVRVGASGDRRRLLGLVPPTRPLWALTAMLISWPLLVVTARIALWVVPSTGEAPLEEFIAWPSGMLAAALLGVVLPAGEELFFRGYLFAAWSHFGRGIAALASVVLFGLLHAAQDWGNWGGLVAVFATGCVLCWLRIATGSTVIAALAHVAYNLTLAIASISAA
jgi:membrane protease YdiL (CAAX protease family)